MVTAADDSGPALPPSPSEALATPRHLQGIATMAPGVTENTPNSGQITISGAFAYDNLFMIDGVDISDNLNGQVNNLFIEALAKSGLGSLVFRHEGTERATRFLHEAMDLWESLRLPTYQWAVTQYLAGIIAESGETDTAGVLLAAVRQAGRFGPGPGDPLWWEMTEAIKSDERWPEWSARAQSLSLGDAVELALTSTRPRR